VLGEFLTPAPLLATALHTAQLLLHGSEDEKGNRLPAIAAGEVSPFALGNVVLEPASRTGSMDQTLRMALAEHPVEVPDDIRAISTALASALQVGAMQRALDMTVQYSKERVQFGRTIGSFQALKHRMADMLVLTESSRSASWGATAIAAAYISDPTPENQRRLVELAAIAGSYCSDALDKIASESVQLHGGIAITWEHDIQLVFKRAHALSQLNGPAHQHRSRVLS
jgi:alkylation response protein AidB-like acyl-CoA dehydrogenase